jgi:hypothetical protein
MQNKMWISMASSLFPWDACYMFPLLGLVFLGRVTWPWHYYSWSKGHVNLVHCPMLQGAGCNPKAERLSKSLQATSSISVNRMCTQCRHKFHPNFITYCMTIPRWCSGGMLLWAHSQSIDVMHSVLWVLFAVDPLFACALQSLCNHAVLLFLKIPPWLWEVLLWTSLNLHSCEKFGHREKKKKQKTESRFTPG